MEDGWWTLPLFMSCGCSGVPGRDAPARMPLLRPPAPVAPDMGRDL